MKQFYLFILGVVIMAKAIGQQQPHYTQYIVNNYIINPAITGIENYTDVKISHRHQWAGLGGSPVTTYLTIHKPIGKKDDRLTVTSFDRYGENPRGKNYWQDYQASKPHHGIGLKIINDRTGPLNRFAGYLNYAYHIGIGKKTSIAAGFEAGLINISLMRNKLDFGGVSQVDPAVYNSPQINKLHPDFGAGIWMYSSEYFVGVSAQQIVPQKIYFSNNKFEQPSKTVPHIFATAGFRFFVNDDISALPSLMLKYVEPLPVQFDINTKFMYRDVLWAGAGYRLKDGFTGLVGINISNTYNISYAYDFTTSPLNLVSRGTHEIVVGFLLGNKYEDWCPRNVW